MVSRYHYTGYMKTTRCAAGPEQYGSLIVLIQHWTPSISTGNTSLSIHKTPDTWTQGSPVVYASSLTHAECASVENLFPQPWCRSQEEYSPTMAAATAKSRDRPHGLTLGLFGTEARTRTLQQGGLMRSPSWRWWTPPSSRLVDHRWSPLKLWLCSVLTNISHWVKDGTPDANYRHLGW